MIWVTAMLPHLCFFRSRSLREFEKAVFMDTASTFGDNPFCAPQQTPPPMFQLGHLRHFDRPLGMSVMPPIATKNGEPLKRRRRARSRRRAAARERQAPVERPAPPLAWPVVHSAAAEVRRFPPPWTTEETDACFTVRDANGQALAYVYFEDEPGRRAGRQSADPRRGPAHRRQHRQAAGVAVADARCVMRPQPCVHDSPRNVAAAHYLM